MRQMIGLMLGIAVASYCGDVSAQTQPKPATETTKAANRAVQQYLDFNNREDFENATRGFIGRPDVLTIRGANGNVVWDMESYKAYISDDKPAPETVNPSLWRNAQHERRVFSLGRVVNEPR